MIQVIGLVVCAYVITKMSMIIFPGKKEREKEENLSIIVVLLAGATMALSAYAIYVLISQGEFISRQLDFLK
jgi:hypothetical protein